MPLRTPCSSSRSGRSKRVSASASGTTTGERDVKRVAGLRLVLVRDGRRRRPARRASRRPLRAESRPRGSAAPCPAGRRAPRSCARTPARTGRTARRLRARPRPARPRPTAAVRASTPRRARVRRSVTSTNVSTTPSMRSSVVRYGARRAIDHRPSTCSTSVSNEAERVEHALRVVGQPVVAEPVREVHERPPDVGRDNVEQVGRARRVALDRERAVEKERPDVRRGDQVLQVRVGAHERVDLVFELVVDRRQLLVGGLQLLLARLQLLGRGLKLLVDRLELFVGRLELLVRPSRLPRS